jgi:hypothetical protein
MDTFTELRQLADHLTELGDTATAALVRQATEKFMAWKFEAGEEFSLGQLRLRRGDPEGLSPLWAYLCGFTGRVVRRVAI